VEFKDYYRALGVARDAPQDEIRKAFRKLARKYHPDVSKEPDAEARMKEVNEAYAVLSDPEKRAAYDQLGRGYRPGEEFRPPPGWDAGFEFSHHDMPGGEFSDFFSELFGRLGARAHGRTISVTAIGAADNTASRLESLTKEVGAQLVVSEVGRDHAGVVFPDYPRQEIELRGREGKLTVHIVADALILAT